MSTILNLIARVLALVGIRFSPPSVDAVMSAFQSTVTKLEDVAAHHSIQADIHDAALAVAARGKELALAEVAKAEATAKRLKEVLGL